MRLEAQRGGLSITYVGGVYTVVVEGAAVRVVATCVEGTSGAFVG